jgi:hypothetical protein
MKTRRSRSWDTGLPGISHDSRNRDGKSEISSESRGLPGWPGVHDPPSFPVAIVTTEINAILTVPSITTLRSPSPPARSCRDWARRFGPARPVASSLGESRRRGDRSVPTALALNRTFHDHSRGPRSDRSIGSTPRRSSPILMSDAERGPSVNPRPDGIDRIGKHRR